jgi:hypothetical protein
MTVKIPPPKAQVKIEALQGGVIVAPVRLMVLSLPTTIMLKGLEKLPVIVPL